MAWKNKASELTVRSVQGGQEIANRRDSMVGIESVRRGLRRLATAVTLAMAIASTARAQTPPLPNPSAPADFAAVAGGPETFSPPDTQPAGVAPSYYAGEGTEPTAPRMDMSLWDTITD